MMKILLANCVYRRGSTGKIVYDTVNFLRLHGHSAIVAYGFGDRKPCKEDPQVYKITFRFEQIVHELMTRLGISLTYGGMPIATYHFIRLIKKEKPDVVHLHCINGNTVNIYRVLRYLGKAGIPTVVTHHAEFYYTGNCGYSFSCNRWYDKECRRCKNVKMATRSRTFNVAHRSWVRMRNSFKTFNTDKLIFTAVSPWVMERAAMSPIVSEFKCITIKNGVETSIFRPCANREVLRRVIPNLHNKIVFHSTASFEPTNPNHIKGGWYIVEMAKRMPDVSFVVASINSSIKIELPPNLHFWGKTKDQQELAMLYSSADVTLVPSKKETFSMICAESLCCGTQIVGFLAGGPESISLPQYSHFVPYGDSDALEKVLTKVLSCTINGEIIASIARKEYNKNNMVLGYLKVYDEVLNS